MTKYPFQDGETVALGPEIFASTDGQTINWRGANYVPQQPPRLTPAEHDRAWHAIEGLDWAAGPDPDTVLNAVLATLGIDPPKEGS